MNFFWETLYMNTFLHILFIFLVAIATYFYTRPVKMREKDTRPVKMREKENGNKAVNNPKFADFITSAKEATSSEEVDTAWLKYKGKGYKYHTCRHLTINPNTFRYTMCGESSGTILRCSKHLEDDIKI